MGLSNAERQARWRAKRDAEVAALRQAAANRREQWKGTPMRNARTKMFEEAREEGRRMARPQMEATPPKALETIARAYERAVTDPSCQTNDDAARLILAALTHAGHTLLD